MNEKAFEWEHKPGEELILHFRPAKFALCSDASKTHFRAAQKEFLLGVRSFLDAAIEYLEQTEKTSPKKKTRIEVQ